MPRAFLVQSFRPEFDKVRLAVGAAASAAGFEVRRADESFVGGRVVDFVLDELETSELVIVDLTGLNPNVMYEMGFAHGAHRPTLVISSEPALLPFDLRSMRFHLYEPTSEGLAALEHSLREAMHEVAAQPERFMIRPKGRPDAKTLFISYSHSDGDVLRRLLVHLRPLEKSGVIDAWNDTRIEAGSDWQHEVQAALDAAAAAVLLVSADFLASDFIVDNELPPLLERAANQGTLIVPMIVKPCRYTRDPVLRRIQAINDPARPLAALPEVEQETLLDAVATAVETAMAPK